MKIEGVLMSWSPRNFGYISVRTGREVKRYFLSMLAVDICEPEAPTPGCKVLFNISPRKPKFETDLPYAANAEIYAKSGEVKS